MTRLTKTCSLDLHVMQGVELLLYHHMYRMQNAAKGISFRTVDFF